TRGIAVVAVTAAVIVAMERAPRGIAGRALSDRRVAYLGRISYATYLLHWPIIVVLTRKIDPGGVWFIVFISVLSTGLACICVHGTGKGMLLMVDSVARMWIPAFTEIARREGMSLAVATSPGCPWWVPEDVPTAHNTCAEQRAYWYQHLIPEYDPDIVVVG